MSVELFVPVLKSWLFMKKKGVADSKKKSIRSWYQVTLEAAKSQTTKNKRKAQITEIKAVKQNLEYGSII